MAYSNQVNITIHGKHFKPSF